MADEGKDYEKLESKYNSMYAELVDAKKQLEKFSGLDLEELKAAKAEAKILKDQLDDHKRRGALGDEAKIKEYLEKKKAEIDGEYKTTYGKKLEELTGKLSATEKKLNRFEVVTPALKKASEIFIPKALPLIEREVENGVRLVDGELVAVDESGKPRRSGKDPRVSMGLDEFLGTLADQYDFMRQAQTTSGGMSAGEKRQGATGGNGRQYTMRELSTMTKEQIDAIPPEDLAAALDR